MKVITKYIDMVAWFTKDGEPHPVRFRYENEDEQFIVIKIDRIIHKECERYAGNNMLVYRCISNINGLQKVYEIKYEVDTCKWILFKI